MENIDLSVLPKGQLAWRAFVEATGSVDDSAERYFLELKSDVDLNSKAGRAKVAKFILGALNRMPDHSARRFEGYALMVLGVACGAVEGIPPFEALELDRDVQNFAGATVRALWDFHAVPVAGGKSVVIIQVSPPQWGDRPLVCRADGDGLVAGNVYVRADGNTRKATAAELDQLHDRMAAGTSATPYVRITGSAYRLGAERDNVQKAFEAKIQATRDELLASVNSPGLRHVLDYGGRDTRGVDGFRREVDIWAEESRQALGGVLGLLAVSRPALSIVVGVSEPRGVLTNVEVDIHLDDDVHVREHIPWDNYELARRLPKPPDDYGSIRRLTARELLGDSHFAPAAQPNLVDASGVVSWTEQSPHTLSVKFSDVRPTKPRQSVDDEFVLLIPGTSKATEVRGRWSLTAVGHSRVYEGDLSVPITTIDLTDAARDALGIAGV
ncbi:hypothetical protein ACWIGI_28645 [Nocardia sp. NPDC055321]